MVLYRHKMKILIIGGSGYIGTNLLQYYRNNKDIDIEFTYLKNEIPFPHGHQLDIIENVKTIKLISKINPDVVIQTAALMNADLCETKKAFADSINVTGTQNVVEGCKNAKCKLTYISTSFVFDGSKQRYFENDPPAPSTYYGITKFKGEELVRNSNLPYLILRIDQPYGLAESWHHTNLVKRVIDNLSSGREHNEIIDWKNTPTYVPDFVTATAQLLDGGATGIYHVVGSDFICRYDWSLITADVFGLDKNLIKPVSSTSLNLAVKRPNVNLSNEKVFQKTGIKMKGVKEGVKEMLRTQEIPT